MKSKKPADFFTGLCFNAYGRELCLSGGNYIEKYLFGGLTRIERYGNAGIMGPPRNAAQLITSGVSYVAKTPNYEIRVLAKICQARADFAISDEIM